MIKKLKPKSEFTRNVLTLMTGTTIAQAIPIAISPILTRIYTPEDFGIFALYISISGILASFSTGRYEMAMMLPKKESEAYNLVMLSLLISVVISLICLIIVVVFNSEITNLLQNDKISTWLYFIPLTIILTGAYQSLYYWNNRFKHYKRLSNGKIIQSSSMTLTNLSLGYLIIGPIGLVLGNIFGQLVSVFYFVKNFLTSISSYEFDFSKIKKTAIRYKKFPKFDALAVVLNMSAHHSIHIFFNMFFGAISSGYYYLVQKIFGVPLLLIASSVQDVFKERITSIYNKGGNTREFFMKTFWKLTLLSILPTILIYLFAIDFFVFFFGDQWEPAGLYVQILTPVFFFRFISFPLSFMFYVTENMHIDVIGQFVLLVLVVITMIIGSNHDAIYTVKILSVLTSVYYIAYLFISYAFTSTGDKIEK